MHQPELGDTLPVYVRGFPAEELVKAARVGVDLLVLGSRLGGPVRRLFHHSVTSAVMQRTDCPALISAFSGGRETHSALHSSLQSHGAIGRSFSWLETA